MSSLISSLVFYGGMTAKQKIKINIDKYGKKKEKSWGRLRAKIY